MEFWLDFCQLDACISKLKIRRKASEVKPECKSLQYSTQAILIEWSHLSKLHPRYCGSLLIDNSLLSQRLFVISFSHFLLWWTLLFRFCYYWFSILNLFVLCRSKWIEKLELQAKTDYSQVENCFLYWCHKSNATQMILIGTVNGRKAKKGNEWNWSARETRHIWKNVRLLIEHVR